MVQEREALQASALRSHRANSLHPQAGQQASEQRAVRTPTFHLPMGVWNLPGCTLYPGDS